MESKILGFFFSAALTQRTSTFDLKDDLCFKVSFKIKRLLKVVVVVCHLENKKKKNLKLTFLRGYYNQNRMIPSFDLDWSEVKRFKVVGEALFKLYLI